MKRTQERQARLGGKNNHRFVVGLVTGILVGFFASSMIFLSTSSTRLLEENHCNDKKDYYPSVIPSYSSSMGRTVTDMKKISIDNQQQPGWKEIHVFFGDRSHIYDTTSLPTPYFYANQWFSQYRQDELVSRLLHGKRNGYFIDLAANDAVRISNTYALETSFNWTGLCIEPNPIYWTGLSYRKCHVVAAIVGNQTLQEVTFRYPKAKAPQGGILGEQYDNKSDQWNEGHPRFTVSLLDIFEKFHVPAVIDYISLDVEGAEDLVMSSFPFTKYRFHLMSVERPSEVLSRLLVSNGYQLLQMIKNVDTLWVHQSVLRAIDRTALDWVDTENYSYRENTAAARIAPEEIIRKKTK
jgi:Methyltransferase FkbM domain